jgi:hypothetical protein
MGVKQMGKTKFPLGQVYLTGGVNDKVADDQSVAEFIWDSSKRQASRDWGDL